MRERCAKGGGVVRRFIRNGRIHGLQRGFVCMEHGVITATGREEDIELFLRRGDETWDAGGAWILPAWTDSHLHVFHLARLRRFTRLQGCSSVEDLARRLATAAPGDWVLGRGWDETLLGMTPDRALLDRLVPDRPALIWRRCGHIAAVNSAALRYADVGPDTTVFGGRVDLDASGQPSGVLRENAIQLVARHVPDPSPEAFRRDVAASLEALAAMGIAAVYSNDEPLHTGDPLAFYRDLYRASPEAVMPRVRWDAPVGELDRQISLDRVSGHGDSMVALGSIKFVTDGSLGGRTAYMLEPYAGEAERGIFRFDAADLEESVERALAHGLRTCLHAIGDAAVRIVLDALEAAGSRHDPLRPRIIHSQFVHPDDLPRYRRTQAIADVQPLFAVSDMPLRERVGAAWDHGYSWRSLLAAGAAMSFSSDAPIESANPILGVRAALARGGRFQDVPNWDRERLDLGLALDLYSAGGAYAGMEEGWRGRLAPGMAADVVVVDPRLFQAGDAQPEGYEDAQGIRPSEVVIGGRPLHASDWRTAV